MSTRYFELGLQQMKSFRTSVASAGRATVLTIAFCLFVVAMSMSLASTAVAQGSSPQTLEGLIEGLRNLQESGAFPDVGGVGRVLDRARERALEGSEEVLEAAPTNRSGLNSAEREVVRLFCQGDLPEQHVGVVDGIQRFSPLERDYCTRARSLVLQVGYQIFDGKFGPASLINGAAPKNFKLGIGDELVITFVGQETLTFETSVDREGRAAIRNLPPIPAAGLTLDQFNVELNARAREAFIGTTAFVSLGAVRAISVLVAGEVVRPGIQQATALSTIIDAIGLAGGIKKTGSLRRVEVHRGDSVTWVDLYDLALGRGSARDLTLLEGDRIVVPPIGSTIAVSGDVKRPGIFELAEGQEGAGIQEILRFTGGTIRPRGVVFRQLSFDRSGLERIEEVAPGDLLARDGDIVVAKRRVDAQLGGVALDGHVRVPGTRSLAQASTVGTLLGGREALEADPYLLLGVLETTDPATSARRFFAISLEAIFSGTEDYQLRDGDRLIVLGREDVAYLSSPEVQQVIAPANDEETAPRAPSSRRQQDGDDDDEPRSATLGTLEQIAATVAAESGRPATQQSDSDADEIPVVAGRLTCDSLVSLRKLVLEARVDRFVNAIVGSRDASRTEDRRRDECRQVFEDNAALLPFLLEHGTAVSGEVRLPGIYPITEGTRLASVVGVAGGLTREVDLTNILVARYGVDSSAGSANVVRSTISAQDQGLADVAVGPGDVVRFNPVFTDRDTGPVFVVGEFARPGSYEIRRGERLSEVIARAGGLTAQAYPYGAVFTRERVKRAEEASLRRLARELNSAVTVAAANRGIDAGAIASFAQLTRDVATAPASGRVVIEADPTVLQVRPELDIVLEPGDRLYMPKRPNSVLVTGDVLNPGAMQFVSGKSINTYIDQAGGFQQSADRGRLFVIFPNGSAQPVSVSPFNYTPVRVPPGSAIVVPKDATPFDIFTISREVASLVSQLAITAASLAVISDN